ncbi:MAG: MFS transporter [Chloroflexota bacterium]|nr:MFS transporter [Chloroflexota bacterium]
MVGQVREGLRSPVYRGALLLAVATAAFGAALNGQQTVVTNYFEHELGLRGAQFGYITAIREVPGFLQIFLTALFYRLSLPKLTAGALLVLALGYGFFGLSDSFWTVVPWVVVSSMGYHTFLQTQYALGLSLTNEGRSGRILGRLSAISNGGALLAMAAVFLAFHYDWASYRATFVACGLLALMAAVAIVRFPHLHNGEVQAQAAAREPIVLRRDYRFYYGLSVLDGARQQIFFSFGLWVLVHRFGLEVPAISTILVAVTTLSMVAGPIIGRLIDRHGERQMLAAVNIAYVVALIGYALVDHVAVAVLCYVVYSFIFPLSAMGAAIYLRKIAPSADIAPSLAMGLTMQHAAAVAVPIATGFVLNFVGYQIPFLIASGFACLTFLVTRRLDPASQKTERRLREEAAQAAASPAPTVPPPVTGAPLEQRPAGLVGDATAATR